MLDLTGQTLKGRYRIEGLIGRGGMAEVYKAWDTRRQYHVAVKVMREDLAEDVEFLRRFQREASALAALSHANVVRFYSFERDGRLAFIVMDYVEGTTLRGRILDSGEQPLPLEEVAAVMRQVCAALHYAHEENVLHRDIKPGNIMIQHDSPQGMQGHVLVADFGIAKAADAATATTVMPGTPAYMSPEQCRSEPLDERADVYSLGIVAYEMLAGRRPFLGDSEATTGSTRERIRWEQVHASPPSLEPFNPGLPPGVEQAVLKALAKEREDRWPTPLAFWQALEQALKVAGIAVGQRVAPPAIYQAPASPPAPGPQVVMPAERPEPVRRRSGLANLPPWAWVLAGVTLVGLLIVITSSLFDQGTAPAPTAVAVFATSTAPAALATAAPVQAVVAGLEPTPSDTATAVSTTAPTETAAATPSDTPTSTPMPTPTPTPTWTSTPKPTATLKPTQPPTRPPTDTPIPKPRVYLQDDFSGSSLDGARWQAYANGGNVALRNARLELRAPPGSTRFPYIHAKGNPFPASGDFVLDLEFSYANSTWSGTGIVVGTELPANGISDTDKERPSVYLFSVWQDNNIGLAVSFGGPPSSSTTVAQWPGPHLDRHRIQLKYVGGAYQVWVDGQQRYQSPPTGTRPSALWFGNPVVLDPSNPVVDLNWTGLSVEYVSIRELR